MTAGGPSGLGLGATVDAASRVHDLAETPLSVSLLSAAAVTVRDKLLDTKLRQEFTHLQSQLEHALVNPRIGYLLEVSIYTNDLGVPTIPSGQMLLPVGPGTEPLDALAEQLRQPGVRATPPEGLRDNSYFVWITRTGEKTIARTVPADFRSYMVAEASKEARRRELIAGWERAMPQDSYQSIVRAEYWSAVATERAALIKDAARRTQAAELTSRMAQIEKEANDLYRAYQGAQAAYNRRQAFLAVLAQASALSSAFRSAMELGELVATKNATPVSGLADKPATDLPAVIEILHREITDAGKQRKLVEQRLRIEVSRLQDADDALSKIYGHEGVPLPARDITVNPLPKLH